LGGITLIETAEIGGINVHVKIDENKSKAKHEAAEAFSRLIAKNNNSPEGMQYKAGTKKNELFTLVSKYLLVLAPSIVPNIPPMMVDAPAYNPAVAVSAVV
jgi:hypothetical protein